MKTIRRSRQHFAVSNSEAARIILANTSRYGGPGSLMSLWADMVLGKASQAEGAEAEPLFAMTGEQEKAA